MTDLLNVVSAIWDQVGDVIELISTTPLLLITIAGYFASLAISIAMQLMGIHRKSKGD